MRVLAQRRDQLLVALVDLLERQPARLAHQVDRPRFPDPSTTASRPDTSFLVGLPRLLAGRLVHGVADHRLLLVAAAVGGHRRVGERALHELVEPVAVALLEGGALGLP